MISNNSNMCHPQSLPPPLPEREENSRGKQSGGAFFMNTIMLNIITILGRQIP